MLGYLGFSALAVQEERSFVEPGKRIGTDLVTIVDDGQDPAGLPHGFDYEGVAKQRVELIDGGICRGVVHDVQTAARAGVTSTGHGLPAPNPYGPFPLNMVMDAGTATREELIGGLDRGLLVTRFHYTNPVHPKLAIVTGMTRDGTFLVEGGRIVGPVKNLRYTQSYLDAMAGTVAVGIERRTLRGLPRRGRRARGPARELDLHRRHGTLMPAFDVDALRAEFPALARELDGRPVAFLDGPGGTQVPQRVIDAVAGYLRDMNANAGGAFETSERSDAMVEEAHAAVADFLGAASPDEIKFGYNMSTLTLHIGRSIGATLGPGDEIVVTTLDHEANVSTWKAMAADRGVTVRTADIRVDDVTLDVEHLESQLGPRTRLVAVGYASNAVGSVNPVREIVARAHEVGALAYVDAVAFAPHGPIDVQALDADFLVCSAYKWFGPHLGAMYGKAEVLERLPAFKVRPAHDRFETGTAAFESIAGTLAATDYLRDVGRSYGDVAGAAGRGARQRATPGARGWHDGDPGVRAGPGDAPDRRARSDRGGDHPRDHRSSGLRVAGPDRVHLGRGASPEGGRRGPGSCRHLRVGRRLLRDEPDRAPRQGRCWRDPSHWAGALQHRFRSGSCPRGGRQLALTRRSPHHRRVPVDRPASVRGGFS